MFKSATVLGLLFVPALAGAFSIQEAVDRRPGSVVQIPPGDHLISERIRISGEFGGLQGTGRIVQTNPKEPILDIENAAHIRIEGIVLTRSAEAEVCEESAVRCRNSRHITLNNLTILNNRGGSASIEIRGSTACTISGCTILNYKRITIDDRTGSPEHYGYAFNAIDGHGVVVERCAGTIVRDNRIVEERLHPDPATQEAHRLGFLTEGKNPSVEGKLSKSVFQRGYVDNWHQGSALLVTGPAHSGDTLIRGNHIENCGQGIDLHTDRVICEGNVVRDAMIGIKGTHGCRHLLIADNLISRVDLWGIVLNPGTGSYAADEERGENVDGGTVIADNLITDFGLGPNYWNWGGKQEDGGNSFAIALYGGQLETNPPLADLVVTGNLVYNSAAVESASSEKKAPRYRYAVYFGSWNGPPEKDPTIPRNIHFQGNLFQPGRDGVSNLPLERFAPVEPSGEEEAP